MKLFLAGQQLRCTKGPLLGQNIHIDNTIVSLEEFVECEWAPIQKCEHCNDEESIKKQ